MLTISLVACSGGSASDACIEGPLFANARARAERAVAELDRTTAIELEEAVLAMVDQVSVMREVSPGSLRDPLGVALAAYGQLVVALDTVGWDPVTASTDAKVASARRAFTDVSVSGALLEIEEFLEVQCEQVRSESNPNFAMTGTTLPIPVISEEPSRDANEDDVPTRSELEALGFAIAESYGVALTNMEAECVARELGTTFAGGNDIDVGDEALFDSVKTSFVSCGITTPPITTPDN
jgi:hypothetical protein